MLIQSVNDWDIRQEAKQKTCNFFFTVLLRGKKGKLSKCETTKENIFFLLLFFCLVMFYDEKKWAMI